MSAPRKIGEQWVKRIKGINYLMEKMPDGSRKAIQRIDPYKIPQRANNKSGTKPPDYRKRIKSNPDNLTNMMKLKGTENIYIAENSRRVDHVVRIDSKTLIIKHKKTA
jgi:hypothetical protein